MFKKNSKNAKPPKNNSLMDLMDTTKKCAIAKSSNLLSSQTSKLDASHLKNEDSEEEILIIGEVKNK